MKRAHVHSRVGYGEIWGAGGRRKGVGRDEGEQPMLQTIVGLTIGGFVVTARRNVIQNVAVAASDDGHGVSFAIELDGIDYQLTTV